MEKIIRECKNSSGKKFGQVIFDDKELLIQHDKKPELKITDPQVIQEVLNKTSLGIKQLYDDYLLGIGEIAALYGVCYATINKKMKGLEITTTANQGRRCSTFGQHHSEETKRKIGEKSKGRIIPQYERTPEIRAKISEGLKRYYADHPVSEETRQKLSQAWVDGKYDHAPMGSGIHGYFFSYKNNTKFYYRSLLELKYLLTLEQDDTVLNYKVEPCKILLEDGIHHYTPDFLVNQKELIELKPANHLNYIKEDERFAKELQAGEKYAKEHNLIFKLIYDTDLDFESKKFKRWLYNNPKIINQYQITFDRDISKWL